MSAPIRIRQAVPADVPALRELIDASVRGLQARDYTAAQIENALKTVYDVDSQLIADGTYFVAEASSSEGGNPVIAGCGGWSKRKTLYGGDHFAGRQDALLDPLNDAAKIRAFFVHPAWARCGIGSMVLENCESAARLAGFSRFEMGATLTGVPFYRAKGYVELERIEVPLADGLTLPIVRMAKQVSAQTPPTMRPFAAVYGIFTEMPDTIPVVTREEKPVRSAAVSARIIAAGIVIAFCYLASSVVVTLLVAILLAYFLDPLVVWLELFRLPRALGSLVVLLLAITLLFFLGSSLVNRVDQFGADWPLYRAPLRAIASGVERRLNLLESRVNEISPQAREPHAITITEPHPVRDALLRRVGSLYTVLFAATFVPFLVFFMLVAKRKIWHETMELFPVSRRTPVKIALAEVSNMLRSYVVGTALVGLILVVASWAFFWAIGMNFSFLTGLVSGLLNLVPYLGMVLAWMPPVIIGLKQFHSVGPFLGICGVLAFFHLMAANYLLPSFVGRRVHLNAVSVTVALLFWGWLWGAPGLLLAIPITGTIKVICDHVEGWQPVGKWLGA